MADAANYMYEKATLKGVGYKNVEKIVQTQPGLAGNKLVEKGSGSGNVIFEKTEMEAARDYDPNDEINIEVKVNGVILEEYAEFVTSINDQVNINITADPCCPDYINFTKEVELEYTPVSYQTGTYDQKWIDKLCAQNYYAGAAVTEVYTNAEHIQKNTEIDTRKQCNPKIVRYTGHCNLSTCLHQISIEDNNSRCGQCTGVLEANFNANVIGIAHIGWLSKDINTNTRGRHPEYGRSVEDLTGVFSIEKFIQLWDNDTCNDIQVDWLPCI